MKKLILGVLVLAVLVACGGTPAAPPAEPTTAPAVEVESTSPGPAATAAPTEAVPAGERTTIRFAVSDYELPMYADMIEAFETENPTLHVEPVSLQEVLGMSAVLDTDVPEDAEARLAAAADVITTGASRAMVAQGLIRDLGPFIEADRNFDANDFYSGALGTYQWSGGTWALPTLINYQLFFFDRDAFDQAGLDYPAAGWTWDDMVAAARQLTERSGEQVTRWGLVLENPAYRLVESQAGELVDYEADPPVPRYDEAAVVDAVRRYADLILEEQVTPYFEPGTEPEDALMSQEQTLIQAGQAAMWIEADIMWFLRGQMGGNVGVAPFPEGLTPASVGGVVMSAGTQQPEAAWRWMDYLSRQPLSLMTVGVKFLPARRSAAEASGYWDDLDPMLADALDHAVSHSYSARETVAFGAFDEALNAILTGESAVDDAMAGAQEQAEAEVQEQAAEQAAATPVPTFVVAAPGGTPAPQGATTITFLPGIGSLNLEPFRDLADRFHEEHPDIVVDVKMPDFLSGTPDLPELAAASDCFEWYPSFQEARNREAILTMAPFVEADPGFPIDDYLPQALDQFQWQGQLMALPADVTPYIIEYNRDILDAAGLDYPSADWTWEDFLDLAVATTSGEGDAKQYGFVAEYYELNDLLLLTERLGARIIDESADPPAYTYNDPATVEALRWYAALTTEHGVKPVFLTDLNDLMSATPAMIEREAMITEGRVAMWSSSPTAAAVFGGRPDLNAGAVPPPRMPDGSSPASLLTVSGYFISAETEHRQACWQWITFLSGEPAAVQGLPARQSVATSDAFRAKVGASQAEAYLATVGEAQETSALQLLNEEEWLGGAIYWYGQAFGQVIEGEATAEEALDAAQRLADDYRACVIAAGDFGEATWEACVQEVDPTLPAFLFGTGN